MGNIMKFLEGKKSYLVAIAVIILGGLDAYNGHCTATQACKAFAIPGWAFSILGTLGIYTRAVAKPSN